MIKSKDIFRAIDDIRRHGETDVFPHRDDIDDLLLEVNLQETFNNVRQMDRDILLLSSEAFSQKYNLTTIHSTARKRSGGVREITLIDPLLNIYYLAIAMSINRKFGSKLPCDKRKRLFSQLFRNRNNYSSATYKDFKETASAALEYRADDFSMVISMDIKDCYGSMTEPLLRESYEFWSVEPILIDKLLKTLEIIGSRGLPVGGNASRIIAEFVLCRIDHYLQSIGVGFYRYADDYILFMPARKNPIELLDIINNHVNELGLSINKQKLSAYAIDLDYIFRLPALDLSTSFDEYEKK